tara:strand:- start:118 stop:354 length:237 start_codon:yes stop_codon:yes gene_type:complete
MTKKYAPIEDLAERLAVSTSTIRLWVNKKAIPRDTYIKVGQTYRFYVDGVEDALLTEKNVATKDSTHDVEFVDLDDDF